MDIAIVKSVCLAAISVASVCAAYKSSGDKALGFWLLAVIAAGGAS